jgi:molecular chaperone DnaK (HSP70)
MDVGPVLVDITSRTLGIRTLGEVRGFPTNRCYSPVIHRNTPLPATRSNLYYTTYPGQEMVRIAIFQGEHEDTHFNEPVGSFVLDGLDDQAKANSEILVRFDLSLDGTLTATAVERATSREKQLTIDNAITRFRSGSRDEAKTRLAEMFAVDADAPHAPSQECVDDVPEEFRQRIEHCQKTLRKARQMAETAGSEDAGEIRQLADQLQTAVARREFDQIDQFQNTLDDVLFYLEDSP